MAFQILTINPTGMFCFGKHETIAIDGLGEVLLEGVNLDKKGNSNAAGKSSLFHTIVQILYGRNPLNEGPDKVINKSLGRYFGRIVLVDGSGRKWRITDVRKWRKTDKYPTETFGETEEPSDIHTNGLRYSGTDVYLELWNQDVGAWVDDRATNKKVGEARLDVKATRKKIVDILNTDYDQFMSIAYMAQQQTLKFIEGTHKDKLQVISELGDLKMWDRRLVAIKADIAQKDQERDRLEAKLSGLGQISFTRPDDAIKDALLSAKEQIDSQISSCDVELAAVSAKSAEWAAQVALVDTEINTILNDIKTTQSKHNDITSQVDLLSRTFTVDCDAIRHEPRPFEIAKLETEIGELNGQIIARRHDLEHLLTGAGRCPRCRTNVSVEHLLKHRERLALDIRVLDDSVIATKDKLAKITAEWDESTSARLNELLFKYNDAKAKLQTLCSFYESQMCVYTSKLDQLKKKSATMGPDPKSLTYGIEQRRLALLMQKSVKDMELNNWSQQLSKFNEHGELVKQTKAIISGMEFNIKHLRMLERMFGDKGIKAYKLNNILTMLNQVLEKYISITSGGDLRVWVTQYREKSDGDATADIQIMVRDNQKDDIPFALYSGGEKQQIMLAFIGAFWQLASRCGAGVNIMCLDEVAANLDNYNTQLFFDFLDAIRTNSNASSIFVVTHNTSIKDQVTFDHTWTVVRRNGSSRIKLN